MPLRWTSPSLPYTSKFYRPTKLPTKWTSEVRQFWTLYFHDESSQINIVTLAWVGISGTNVTAKSRQRKFVYKLTPAPLEVLTNKTPTAFSSAFSQLRYRCKYQVSSTGLNLLGSVYHLSTCICLSTWDFVAYRMCHDSDLLVHF